MCTLIYVIVDFNHTILQHCYFETPLFLSCKGAWGPPFYQSQSTYHRHSILLLKYQFFRFDHYLQGRSSLLLSCVKCPSSLPVKTQVLLKYIAVFVCDKHRLHRRGLSNTVNYIPSKKEIDSTNCLIRQMDNFVHDPTSGVFNWKIAFH